MRLHVIRSLSLKLCTSSVQDVILPIMIPAGHPEDKQPNETLQKSRRTAVPPIITTTSVVASRSLSRRGTGLYRGRGRGRGRAGHSGSSRGGPQRLNKPSPSDGQRLQHDHE